MGATTYLKRRFMREVLAASPVWLGVAEARNAPEFTVLGYKRQRVMFTTTDEDEALVRNLDLVQFRLGPAPASVGAFTVWDSEFGGNLLWEGDLLYERSLEPGDILRFEPESITLAFEES